MLDRMIGQVLSSIIVLDNTVSLELKPVYGI